MESKAEVRKGHVRWASTRIQISAVVDDKPTNDHSSAIRKSCLVCGQGQEQGKKTEITVQGVGRNKMP